MNGPMSRTHRIVKQRLESLRDAGVEQIGRSSVPDSGVAGVTSAGAGPSVRGSTASPDTPASAAIPTGTAARSQVDAIDRSNPTMTVAERQAALNEMCSDVAACVRCEELASQRTQTVFGVGNPQARLVFVGEAPGAEEDRLGEPFMGRAGKLLNQIIEACTLRREDVYIMNVLKCRPPRNRTPASDEVANCRNYFVGQLDIIQPEIICCLGAVAATNLLDSNTPIGKLRGRLHDYRGIKLIATYHPAYLLRNPDAKRMVWEDMQIVMKELGIPVPRKKKP